MKLKKVRLITFGLLMTPLFSYAAVIHVSNGESIQAAVNKASSGDTILVAPGTYRETVYIDKENITLQGEIIKGKRAWLDGGGKLNDGILAAGNGVSISGFAVKGYKGNSIMTQGANNYRIVDNYVQGGFYGIFPQFGRNGLVARNRITGVEDAGIYLGMSDNVDMIGNEAWGNVIGIEAENSRNVLMEGNFIHDNVEGIAASLFSGLPIKDAKNITIRGNFVVKNNIKNFAPASSIASSVPSGIGVLILGAKNSTVENNIISENNTSAIVVTDLVTFGLATDSKVDPIPDGVQILENTYVNNGTKPVAPFKEMIHVSGNTSADIIASGKERTSCIKHRTSTVEIGTKKWNECEIGATTASLKTAMLDQPYVSPPLNIEQKGRLTYLSVCTGCHAFNTQIHGPSILSIKALYAGDPDGLVKYISNPVKKRKDFADMPKQDYLSPEILNSVAHYILDELKN